MGGVLQFAGGGNLPVYLVYAYGSTAVRGACRLLGRTGAIISIYQ